MRLHRRFISFDWALKRLLRSKANFQILEGFLSELLKDDLKIVEILESEGNKETQDDKFNRVDLMVKNNQGELLIIEVQYDRQLDYLQRILYGTAKTITEHIKESDAYSKVVKVISIHILYFDLGQGEDYIYHGTTRFHGLHRKDELQLSSAQQKLFSKEEVYHLYPEYYLLKINRFNDNARDALDEWIYFLKNEDIKEGFSARGLEKAKEVLDYLKLSDTERRAYERYSEDLHYQASMYESTYIAGGLQERESTEKERIAKEQALEAREREREAKEQALEAKEQALEAREREREAKEQALEAGERALNEVGKLQARLKAAGIKIDNNE